MDHPRQKREMIVLHQYHRIGGLGLDGNGLGKFLVDAAILLEVGRAKGRTHVGNVTEGPQAFVGEARVVACFLLLRQPDATHLVQRMFGRHSDAVAAVDGFAIGRSAAMRNPRAGACTHHGLECRDQSASRALQMDAFRRSHVDVGLAVRYGDDVVAVQFAAQRGAQRLLVPDALAAVERPVLALEVADQFAQVARNGSKLGYRVGRSTQQAFATQQRAQAPHPAAP